MRLDVYLVGNGLCRSRATACEAIRAGCVSVNGKVVAKPSLYIDGTESVTVNADNEKYVSRGGYKLERALDMLRLIEKKAPGMFFYFEARAEFIDRELDPVELMGKASRLDLLGQTPEGEKANLEIQVIKQEFFANNIRRSFGLYKL